MHQQDPLRVTHWPALYLLFNKSGTHFRVAAYATPASCHSQLKKLDWVNYNDSFVVEVSAAVGLSFAASPVRTSIAEFRDDLPERPGEVFYSSQALPALKEHLADKLEKGVVQITPLSKYAAGNAEEAEDLLKRNKQRFERYKLEGKRLDEERLRATREETERYRQAAERQRQAGRNHAVEQAMASAIAFSSHKPSEALQQVRSLLRQLDLLTAGWLELTTEKGGTEATMLAFTLSPDKVGEAGRLVSTLCSFLAFDGEPVRDDAGNFPFCYRLFEAEQPPRYPAPKFNNKRFLLRVCFPTKALQPGIRGWDLPLTDPHLDFHPSKSRRFGGTPVTPVTPAPRAASSVPASTSSASSTSSTPAMSPVRKLWAEAGPRPSAALRQQLVEAGLFIDFEMSYALRYVERHAPEARDGGPLMLVRLATSNRPFVGYAAHHLDTGQTVLHTFEPQLTEPYLFIWAEQEQVLVATTLADAVALNARFRCPVVVTPTPASLQAYRPSPVVEQLVYSLAAHASEEWLMPLREVVAQQRGGDRVVKCVEPGGDAGERTWAEYLPSLKRNAKVKKRDIQLSHIDVHALVDLTGDDEA